MSEEPTPTVKTEPEHFIYVLPEYPSCSSNSESHLNMLHSANCFKVGKELAGSLKGKDEVWVTIPANLAAIEQAILTFIPNTNSSGIFRLHLCIDYHGYTLNKMTEADFEKITAKLEDFFNHLINLYNVSAPEGEIINKKVISGVVNTKENKTSMTKKLKTKFNGLMGTNKNKSEDLNECGCGLGVKYKANINKILKTKFTAIVYFGTVNDVKNNVTEFEKAGKTIYKKMSEQTTATMKEGWEKTKLGAKKVYEGSKKMANRAYTMTKSIGESVKNVKISSFERKRVGGAVGIERQILAVISDEGQSIKIINGRLEKEDFIIKNSSMSENRYLDDYGSIFPSKIMDYRTKKEKRKRSIMIVDRLLEGLSEPQKTEVNGIKDGIIKSKAPSNENEYYIVRSSAMITTPAYTELAKHLEQNTTDLQKTFVDTYISITESGVGTLNKVEKAQEEDYNCTCCSMLCDKQCTKKPISAGGSVRRLTKKARR